MHEDDLPLPREHLLPRDVPDQKIYPAMQKFSEKKRIRKEKKHPNSNFLVRGKEKKDYEISLLVLGLRGAPIRLLREAVF